MTHLQSREKQKTKREILHWIICTARRKSSKIRHRYRDSNTYREYAHVLRRLMCRTAIYNAADSQLLFVFDIFNLPWLSCFSLSWFVPTAWAELQMPLNCFTHHLWQLQKWKPLYPDTRAISRWHWSSQNCGLNKRNSLLSSLSVCVWIGCWACKTNCQRRRKHVATRGKKQMELIKGYSETWNDVSTVRPQVHPQQKTHIVQCSCPPFTVPTSHIYPGITKQYVTTVHFSPQLRTSQFKPGIA